VTAILDSARRCPRCSKRLIVESGQRADRGDIEIVHVCWNCPYRELHSATPLRQSVGKSLADQLRNLRLEDGPLILLPVYDDTPFPEMQWDDEEVAHVQA
jgi:hypothetical protein